MTTKQYQELWSTHDFMTYMVIDPTTDTYLGNVVASTFDQVNDLLDLGIWRTIYPVGSVLVKIQEDTELN